MDAREQCKYRHIFKIDQELISDSFSILKLIPTLQMTAGMGGLTQGYMDLVEGEDKAEFQNPAAIMGNLQANNMLMGPQIRAIANGGH